MIKPQASPRAERRAVAPSTLPLARPVFEPAPLPFGDSWLELVRFSHARYLADLARDEEADRLVEARRDPESDIGDDPSAAAELEARHSVLMEDAAQSALRLLDALTCACGVGIATRPQPSRAFFSGGHLYVLACRDDELPYMEEIRAPEGNGPLRTMMLFRIPLDRVHSLDRGEPR